MPEALQVVLGLAVLLGLGWVLNAAKAATRRTATRAVFRKTHQGGQAEVQAVTTVQAPVDAASLMDTAVRTVNPYEQPPKVVAGLFLAQRSATSATFAFGSKLGNSFTMRLDVESGASGGSTGTLRCLTWSEVDGLVSDVSQIQRVRARVAEAAKALGGAGVAP